MDEKKLVKKKDGKKRCPHCGAIINHQDDFCHKCYEEFEKKDLQPFDYRDFN